MPCVRRAIRGHNQHCVLCARARAKMRLRAEVANKLNISEQRVQLMLGGSGGGSEFGLQRTMYDHLQLEKHFNEPQSRNANHQTKSVCNIFHRMRRGPGKSRMSYGQLTCCIITDEPREREVARVCPALAGGRICSSIFLLWPGTLAGQRKNIELRAKIEKYYVAFYVR